MYCHNGLQTGTWHYLRESGYNSTIEVYGSPGVLTQTQYDDSDENYLWIKYS